MFVSVLRGRKDLQVLGIIVLFVAIAMMHVLALAQRSPDDLFGHDPMLVRIATNVGQRMILADSNQDVAIAGDRSAASPIRITWSRMDDAHG